MKIVRLWNAGRLNYRNAWNVQKWIENRIKEQTNYEDTLLLVEHSPVYTIGIRTTGYSNDEKTALQALGAEFVESNRGGLITFHGPGQLVAYPVLNLKRYKPSVRWYVSELENCVIDVCKRFGVSATTSPDTGVWVGDKKVCAIGVHASRFVTTHGLALNCNNDLKWFEHIVPCGLVGKGVTSLSHELNRDINVSAVIPVFLDSFSDHFKCTFELVSENDKNEFLRIANN